MTPVHYRAGAFPPKHLRWEALIELIGPASAAVARYDGILAAMPNADVLLSPLMTHEAVLSSRIEGTQATMGEVLAFEADTQRDISDERREDIHEVLNYRRAMRLAEEMLRNLPLCVRVICALHETLLEGVRGHGKSPGRLRRVPNWIGPPGCTIEQARYVPIAADKLAEAISTWERFVHDTSFPDRLVQLALLHAEFEALHPFLDGNGRLGRMLIPLFLWQRGLIREPRFYMSAYLEARRDAYYERLLAVSRDGDWTGWCRFFLEGVQRQAEENLHKAQAILALYEELKPRVIEWTRSQYAVHALDWIFSQPIFRSSSFYSNASIPLSTARRILAILRDEGLVREISAARGRRAALLAFPRLLNIAEGQEVF